VVEKLVVNVEVTHTRRPIGHGRGS
jgi:hypothetical protein